MRIICPACGENTTVPELHPTGIINCAACGKRIRFADPAPSRGDDDIDFEVDASVPAALAPAKPIANRFPKAASRPSPLLIALLTLMAITMLVMLGLVVGHSGEQHFGDQPAPVAAATSAVPQIPWDQAHRSDLLALKASADSLARDGRWQASYDAYQQILTFIGDHTVSDPVAVTVVESVRPGQDRAMSALTSHREMPVPLPAPQALIAQAPPTVPSPPASVSFPPAIAATPPATSPAMADAASTQPTTAPVATLDARQIAADSAPPLPGPPPPPPSLHAYTLPDAVTDEQIGDAINKGVKFLASQFRNGAILGAGMPAPIPRRGGAPPGPARPPGQDDSKPPPGLEPDSDLNQGTGVGPPQVRVDPPRNQPRPGFAAPGEWVNSASGADALCVYALLNAGRAMNVPGLGQNDPDVIKLLETLKAFDMRATYQRSLRAAALAVFNRPEDRAALEDDVNWLENASMHGAYTYGMPNGRTNNTTSGLATFNASFDNSNSQYGLLGVWSGAQAGISVSRTYWQDIEQHWNSCTTGDGQWGYRGIDSLPYFNMTCAGIASLLVARDYLDSPSLMGDTSDRPSPSPAVDAGLDWLDSGDNCMGSSDAAQSWGSYGLYGLERVGLASGFKYFGKHDWYSEIAKKLVAQQSFNGAWGSDIDTAYCLLFLSRGRHPILYNKLRYDGAWNNRPHDVAHLANYAAHELERPLNWQVVNLRHDWYDWMDCPVLFISGDRPLNLTAENYAALQGFAYGGGLIFTHADGDSPQFTKWVSELVRKIFPKYELVSLPRDHPIYSTVYRLKTSPTPINIPPLLGVSNGSRVLLIHSPTDIAGGWQLNWTDDRKTAFQMGVNLFVYAAGKVNLKNRLASTYIPPDPDRPDSRGQFAVLQYPGEWNPEPYAWTRFSRFFQWETRQALDPIVVPMKELTPKSQPMAVLTGTVRHDFTDAENAAVKAYVQAGGVLVIDACGGQSDFARSVEQTLLPTAFAGATPTPIAVNHPLLIPSRPHADNLTIPMLRGYARENGGKDLPIETIAFGKGWVIFSRLDITTGLLGTQSWGILGFEPAYAQSLLKNALLWAQARAS